MHSLCQPLCSAFIELSFPNQSTASWCVLPCQPCTMLGKHANKLDDTLRAPKPTFPDQSATNPVLSHQVVETETMTTTSCCHYCQHCKPEWIRMSPCFMPTTELCFESLVVLHRDQSGLQDIPMRMILQAVSLCDSSPSPIQIHRIPNQAHTWLSQSLTL